MVSRTTLALGAAASVAAGAAARRYVQDRTTPRVPFETVARVGDVEVRRYPPTVVVETVAPTEREASRRLFGYVSGANRSDAAASTTAPVESEGDAEPIPTTAPVESESVSTTAPMEPTRGAAGVRMAFVLLDSYDFESAPRPTDERVRLVERPGRTLAVIGFSWWATDWRVERKTAALRATLAAGTYDATSDPLPLRDEGPWVPPFLRTNEVAVPLRRASSGAA